MFRRIMRYRVHPEAVAEVRQAVRRLVDSVRENEPDTIYGVMAGEDRTCFIHIMAFPDEFAEQRYRNAAYTREFKNAIAQLVDEPLDFLELDVVRATGVDSGFLGVA